MLDEFIPRLKVVGFKIEDKEYTLKSYASIVSEVVKYTLNIDREKFMDSLIDSETNRSRNYYIGSKNKDLVYYPDKIEDFYFECGGSGSWNIRKKQQ